MYYYFVQPLDTRNIAHISPISKIKQFIEKHNKMHVASKGRRLELYQKVKVQKVH